MNTAVGGFLVGRHRHDACPCRKKHHSAPKPQAPDAPPNTGKRTKRLREALEALEVAHESEEENVETRAQRLVDLHAVGLESYCALYKQYLNLLHAWSSDVCGDCGMSLHVPVPTLGCARCLSVDAVELLALVGVAL